jgi:hypothetical protein
VLSKVNVWAALLFGATWPVTNRRAWQCPAWPETIDLTGIGFGKRRGRGGLDHRAHRTPGLLVLQLRALARPWLRC